MLTVYDNTPHAIASASTYFPPVGLTVNFSGTSSYHGRPIDRSIVSYDWDFGDATPTASGIFATHAYSQTGVYSVSLTVGDNNVPEKTNTTTFSITVVPEPPVALPFCGIASFALICRRHRNRS